MFSGCHTVFQSIRLYNQTYECDVLKTNPGIVLMKCSTSDPHGKGMKWSTFGYGNKT